MKYLYILNAVRCP